MFPGRRRRRIHHGGNVFVLPFEAILRGVAAGTSASPVECMNRAVLF
jgi:hypothetical protein